MTSKRVAYSPPKPVLNGCYAFNAKGMIKVRMLCYRGDQLDEVLVEDLYGDLHRLAIDDWNDIGPIPCCLGNNIRRN